MWRRGVLLVAGCGLLALLFWGTNAGPSLPAAEEPAAKATKAPAEAAPAPAAPKTANNRVASVTVYPNSALVTREVDVPAGQGSTELTVTPLPPTTVQSSLYAEGTEGLRVLSTRFRTRPILEDTREEVRRLQEEIKQLQRTQDKADADIKANLAVVQYVAKLESFTASSTATATDKGKLNSEATIELSKYIIQTRAEKSKEQVDLQHQVDTLKEKSEFAKRKLAELTSSPSRTEHDAIIVVDRGNAGPGKVRLNYLVEAASWRPQYKLRAGKDVKEPVKLEYLAAVTQHTGEEWNNVKLVLSTAQPTLNAAPPDLLALSVTAVPRGAVSHRPNAAVEDEVRALRGRAQKDFNEKKPTSGAGLFNTAAALDQNWELLNPEAAVKRGCAMASSEGPSVTYHLTTPLTVPSRNDEQVVEVTRFEVAPEFYYKAVPVLTSHVYRLADLTNKSKHVLLPGEATMYAGTDFVGQMNLPLVAIGETFTAGFGVDPQLQVQRQMMDRTRTLRGGNQSLKYEYRILVSSFKSEKVKVQVWDRLPHADNEAVGVTLVKATPEVSKDGLYQREQRDKNLLRWDVQIEPNMTGERAMPINYEFKLDLDRQMTISTGPATAAAPNEPAKPGNPAPAAPAMTSSEEAQIRTMMARLSPEDRKLAEAQVWCAIDQESRLGTMGPILKEMAKGKPVFICCKGCAAEVRSNPDDALRMLNLLANKMKGPQGKR